MYKMKLKPGHIEVIYRIYTYIYRKWYFCGEKPFLKVHCTCEFSLYTQTSTLKRGAKWFRYRVSIHHPLGLKDGTVWKVLES